MNQDNIVEFIDFRTGDKPYLVMGFAVGGTLEQQCKTMPFNVTETTILLGQMLEALVYLHVEFGITHRDIKPANILCDSRTRCRLADFGLAKEGDVLKTFGGTQPYMAPEMFTRKPYTSAVDLWALGVVIAQLLSPSRPPGYRGDEGQRWCAAVIAQFRKYNEYFEALDFEAIDITYHEQKGLHLLVGTYLLKMNPDDRESASVCLEIWKHFCLTESVSNTLYVDHANGPSKSNASMKKNEASESYGALEEESAPEEGVIGPSEVNGSLRDNDSEADTEIPDERPPNSEEWLELEDEHPNNEANVVMIEDFSIDQEIDGGNGVKAPQDFVFNALANLSGLNWHPLFKESPHSASPAAPTGVRKSVHKRNASSIAKSVKAAAARQAAEDQS